MGILETMNNVIKSCKEEVFRNPSRLKEISHVIRDVLKKKVRKGETDGGEEVALFAIAEVTHIVSHKWYILCGSYARDPSSLFFSPFSLSVQTVCQDSGGDDADDEDQQVGVPLAV